MWPRTRAAAAGSAAAGVRGRGGERHGSERQEEEAGNFHARISPDKGHRAAFTTALMVMAIGCRTQWPAARPPLVEAKGLPIDPPPLWGALNHIVRDLA